MLPPALSPTIALAVGDALERTAIADLRGSRKPPPATTVL